MKFKYEVLHNFIKIHLNSFTLFLIQNIWNQIKIIYKINNQLQLQQQYMNRRTISVHETAQSKTFFNLEGSSLMGNKSMAQGSNKKIQGRDVLSSSKQNFEQTVNKLKSKPNQKILQDEYIKGLQQEIKYLEYELKLLKDKEIMQREGVNELDNFLKDEIPINQNILAMKNKYNSTKNKLQQQIKLLGLKQGQAKDVLQTQKNQIKRLHQIIGGHRDQVSKRNVQFKKKLSELVRLLTLVEDQSITLNGNNKQLQNKIKKMTDQISTIQRTIQKQKILEVKTMEQKQKAQEKFIQVSRKTKAQMLEALQKVQEMNIYKKEKGTNPLADDLQQKNSALRKKIMVTEKQLSTAENIVSEIKLFLQEQAKQRQIQRKQKLKITNNIEDSRNELQNLERFSDNMIKEQTLRIKKIMLKQMEHDQLDKSQTYQKLLDQLSYLQKFSSDLITQKKDLQLAIQTQETRQKQFLRNIKELNQHILSNKCDISSLFRINKQIQSQINPLKNELQSCQERIPIVSKEIQKREVLIAHLVKQIELLKQLKGLDFDHLHMISTSGTQMQNTLNQFIKNWEKLKSSS